MTPATSSPLPNARLGADPIGLNNPANYYAPPNIDFSSWNPVPTFG